MALIKGARILHQNGLDDAKSAAKLLLCHVLDTDMHGILVSDTPMTNTQAAQLTALIDRAAQGEPVQYIMGYAYFSGLRFIVTPDVLIPRADTETIVRWAVQNTPLNARVLDVCTGSGCIAVALKNQRSDLEVFAGDISEKALVVARKNAQRNGTDIDFMCGDLCASYGDSAFDIILANPPYIDEHEMKGLPKNVREFEPYAALYGGADGLDITRRLISEATARLNSGGALCVEIGCKQGQAVNELYKEQGFGNIRVLYDMENRPRAVAGVWEDRA